MRPNRDIEPVLDAWLAPGPTEMPDDLFRDVLRRIEHVPQRRFAWAPRRFTSMFSAFKLATAAVMAGLVIGVVSVAPLQAPAEVAQSIAGAAGVWLIGLIALRAGGNRAGLTAAAIAAVYPPLVWFPSYVLSETLYSFVALASAAVLQLAVDRAHSHRSDRAGSPLSLAAGALTGVSVLVRPAMLFFLPLALLWLSYRRMPVLAVTLVAGAAAVIAPITLL